MGPVAELKKPFPAAEVKFRRIPGGRSSSYVDTNVVIDRLDAATDGAWSFRIVRTAPPPDAAG